VSIHDTISLHKLQSLGKCHNENMYKATCLAVILADAIEEETIYWKRKRNIWTKEWLKRRSVFRHSNLIKELKLSLPLDYKNYLRMCPFDIRFITGTYYSMRINDEMVTWYSSSQTCLYTLQTVAQPDCCATKFKPV